MENAWRITFFIVSYTLSVAQSTDDIVKNKSVVFRITETKYQMFAEETQSPKKGNVSQGSSGVLYISKAP